MSCFCHNHLLLSSLYFAFNNIFEFFHFVVELTVANKIGHQMTSLVNNKIAPPKMMRTCGIVTGISHISGGDYYMQINNKVQSLLPTKYAGYSSKIALFSVNLEEYVEYLHHGRYDLVNALLCDAADRVIRAGADFIVLASNTAHMAFDYIAAKHPYVPILHIADSIAARLKRDGIKCVGLVGTAHTMQGRYITDRLREHGVSVVVPKQSHIHEEMERIIETELSFNKFEEKSRDFIVQVISNELVSQQGAQACILGCTEIELLVKPEHIKQVPLYNSAQIHIDAAVEVQLGLKNVWDFLPRTSLQCRL